MIDKNPELKSFHGKLADLPDELYGPWRRDVNISLLNLHNHLLKCWGPVLGNGSAVFLINSMRSTT